MKFKNYIETESGIKDTSTSPGTAGQLLSSTVAGTSWIDQNTISSGTSEVVDIQVKNISSANGGINLSKGDPVYIYGSVGASARLYVDLADADSTATNNLGDGKMPCVGLLDQDLSPNGEGTATVVGKLRNLITNPIDGDVPNENDTVYVKSGGGLTLTKPTGSTNLIQNVGQVGRVSTSADGNIVVAALLRSNDVPNLPEGRIWIGDGNTIVSDTVYVDEPNNRVGINTATPIYDLDVDGAIRASGGFIDNTFTSDDTVRIVSPDNATYTVASGGETGAIKIQAPLAVLGGVTGTSTKVSFKVNTSDGVVIQFSGTFSRPGIGIIDIWTNISATIISDASNDANYTITGTGSGSGGIWIGSSTDSQAGLKSIWVTDCQVSGGNGGLFNGSPQSSAWDVSIDASVPTGFTAYTYSNTQVTNWKRNGQDLYYGSGSGNVGIGKTNPGAKLEVVGSTGVIIDSGSSSAAKLTLIGDGSPFGGGASIDVIGGSNDYLSYILNIKRSPSTLEASNSYFQYNAGWEWNGNQSNSRAQPYTSYSFRSQGSSQMVIYNNNLGIGVTTPSQKLHVNGNARVTGSYYDSSNSPGAANSVLISTISGTVWGARGPLGGGTTNYLARWTPDGNTLGIGVTYDNGTSVGIGTTSPGTYKLAVAGSTAIGENLEVSDGLGGDKTLSIDATVGTFQIGDIDGIGDEAYVEGDSSSIKIFTGGGETLVCDINQRVGIGLDIPQAKLHVQNYTTGESHQAMFKGGSVNIGDYSYISLNGGYASDYGKEVRLAAVSESAFGNTTGFAVLTSPDSSGASGHERLRVTADGNVGIGTIDPTAKLDVVQSTAANGEAALHLIGPSSNPALTSSVLIIEQGDGKKITIDGNDIDVSSGDLFINDYSKEDVTFGGQIKVNGGGTPVGDSYFANGNVGIGTTNPNAKLEIAGHSSSGKFLLIDNVASGETFLNVEDGFSSQLLQIKRETDNTISFNSYNDFNFIDNVGIKQTNPLHPLDVNGEIHSSTYVSATAGLGVDSTTGTLGRGISLYAGPSLYPQYGLLFARTVDLGTYGGVSGDWATYMTMSGTATRGWIWKAGAVDSTSNNVASISGVGQLTLASTATATNFILSSDKTLKDNIKEIDTKHVDVDWKNFELKSEPGIKRAGVIAQELEIKHPEFVRTADDGLKSVAYIDLLITKIAELEARLEKLEK